MANVAVTAAQVGRVDPSQDVVRPGIAGESITAGQLVYLKSDGKFWLADGSETGTAQVRGMALNAAGANQALNVLVKGLVYGFTLTSLAYDQRVYLSDTAGAVNDTNGTVTVPVARVWPMSDADLTKVLYFFGAAMEDQYT